MDLKKEILREHSKAQTTKIALYIQSYPDRFQELMELFLQGEYRITQRASWIVSCCAETNPELIIPYLKKMLDNLKSPVHDAVKRNTLRILQSVEIQKKLRAPAANICFRFLESKQEPVAIKAFAMTVLFNISQEEPELKNELKILIEDQLPYSKPAFTSRGNKILKALKEYHI